LKGTAEVVFSRRQDALAAAKRYNNVQLDGKPMKIEIVGTNILSPPAPQAPQVLNGVFGNFNPPPRRYPLYPLRIKMLRPLTFEISIAVYSYCRKLF